MSTTSPQDHMLFYEQNPFENSFSLFEFTSAQDQKSADIAAVLNVYDQELSPCEQQTPASSFYSFDQSTRPTPHFSLPFPASEQSALPISPVDCSVRTTSTEQSRTIPLPIVVPQNSNVLFIKHLSPFARCYPPALNSIETPVSQEEFLNFIDGLNSAFVTHPALLATMTAGGAFMGFGTSAMAAFIKVRNYLEKFNRDMFKSRGLVARIVTTKKMMESVGLTTLGGKGKMMLCGIDDRCEEDPRERRLRSLDGYVMPLDFDVPEQLMPKKKLKKILNTPTTLNEKVQMNMLLGSRRKILKSLNSYTEASNDDNARIADLERIISECQMELCDTSLDIDVDTMSAKEHIDIHNLRAYLTSLEAELALEKQTRDYRLQKNRISHAKTFAKIDKKENKIVNRILWLVITKDEGQTTFFERGSEDGV